MTSFYCNRFFLLNEERIITSTKVILILEQMLIAFSYHAPVDVIEHLCATLGVKKITTAVLGLYM